MHLLLSWVLSAGLMAATPLLVLAHCALVLLDKIHRAICRRHQRNWPHKTVPHVRAELAVAASETGLENWRLECVEGRQRWHYVRGASKQTFVERYNLGLHPPQPRKPRATPAQALDDGIAFLLKLQDADGHWPNDYSGPMFLLPGAVITKYICFNGDLKQMFPTDAHRLECLRYLKNAQNADGGWGMHTESHSTMFGTALNYVTMRMLGEDARSPFSVKAQRWIRNRGGAVSIPSWGKGWLSIANLYSWDGLNPVPPEMWLLPYWLPISMGRIWCHSRIVTLPFGYLYGKRWQAPLTPLLVELRSELYTTPYAAIPWAKHRGNVFPDDIYTPHSWFYKFGNLFLLAYEKFGPSKKLRDASLAVSWEHIQYDDKSTDYICLGPVNKALNMLITFIELGRESAEFKRHVERLEDYFWIGADGMRMSGYNGSQLWDTSFAVQAIHAAGKETEHAAAMWAAHEYVNVAQVLEDPPEKEKYFRHRTKGAWNFSTRSQSWQVSDCTAEGLRVVLLLRGNDRVVRDPFPIERIYDAVDEILSLRNIDGDGGWASYEPARGHQYLELLNCAEVYKDIMIDYTYTECSSSCTHSLFLFHLQFPHYRTKDVLEAIAAGVKTIKRLQRADGSWYGSWGVCFTYGAFFATETLALVGEPLESPTMRKACEFLLGKQNADGGWGEDFNACVTQEWVPNPDGSQVVNTAWAVMALINAGGPKHADAIERGVRFIMSRQLADGDWAQERISGVFNGNCAIHYPAYKNNMTVWALGKYCKWATMRSEQRK